MKRLVFTAILLLTFFLPKAIVLSSPADPKNDLARFSEDEWSKDELTMANTAGDKKYLSPEERDLILYTNLVRMDGEKFFNTFFQDFIDAYNHKMEQYSNYSSLKISRTDSYYKSLEKDILKGKDLPVFWPDEALSWVARQHGKDMNKYNYAAHKSRDGRNPKDRIWQMYPKKSTGENLAFGFSKGLENVCMLLLDKGVPDLGHRKLLLDTSYDFNFIGVSIQPHRGYKFSAVMDLVALPR
jgi:hypothetical protein